MPLIPLVGNARAGKLPLHDAMDALICSSGDKHVERSTVDVTWLAFAEHRYRHAAKVDASSESLPAGVQIVARPYADEMILDALAALEQELHKNSDYPCTPHVFDERRFG